MLRLPVAVALPVPHDWLTVSEAPSLRSCLLSCLTASEISSWSVVLVSAFWLVSAACSTVF
jgi:hypothetical protein